jgi:hypothetical protein
MKFYYKTDVFGGAVIAMIATGKESDGLTDLTEKRECLYDLVNKECPMGRNFTNSECPLGNIRKLTSFQKKQYVACLSEEEINSIYNYHADCCGFFSFYQKEGNDQLVGIAKHQLY